MIALKLLYIAGNLVAALVIDPAPFVSSQWVCRMSSTAPAGFTFEYTLPQSGDVLVQYEDQCEPAIQAFADLDI